MRTLFLALCTALACGCSAVYVSAPVGERPHDLTQQAKDWNGTWNHEDGSLSVSVADSSNGILRIAWVEDDARGFTTKTARVYLRDVGPALFATLALDSEPPDRLLWARIKRQGRTALVWAPNAARIKELVADGRLPGSTNAQDVILKPLSAKDYELLLSETNGFLFSWDSPMVLLHTSPSE